MAEIISWNSKAKLIVSDVDETIADLYVSAEPAMIEQLEKVLAKDIVLFLITGQSLKSVQWRITDKISPAFRAKIVIGHCSGAEVVGFKTDGTLRDEPFYSLYETALTETQKKLWREIIQQLINEFNLKTFPTMPIEQFKEQSAHDPLSIMFEDRGPQITFELVNGYELSQEAAQQLPFDVPLHHDRYDIREPLIKRAEILLKEHNLPITPRLAGMFAIDFALKGVSKTTAIKKIIDDSTALESLGLPKDILNQPETIEIWGDKFSSVKGGTDRHMCEALPKSVRAITFRHEDPQEFLDGYSIMVWNGAHQLHDGLLEYLKTIQD